MGLTSKQRGRWSMLGGVEQGSRTYATDGALPVNLSHTALLTKGSAAAMTLAAPARDNITLTILARTAFTHQVTATGLIDNGTAASKTTLAFAAGAGASITLFSAGGKWNVTALSAVTVS